MVIGRNGGKRIAQSVLCLASDYLNISAVQVRIPLATLAKIKNIKKISNFFCSGMFQWFDSHIPGCLNTIYFTSITSITTKGNGIINTLRFRMMAYVV